MSEETFWRERKFYSSQEWQDFRQDIIARDESTCQVCGCILKEGRTHPRSAAVDHKLPISTAWEQRLTPSNVWAVCKHCHESTLAKIERQYKGNPDAILKAKANAKVYGYDSDGKPTDPNHPWNR